MNSSNKWKNQIQSSHCACNWKKDTKKQAAATIITTTGIRAPNNKRARNKPEWKQSCFKYVWNLPANGRERWCAGTLSESHTWNEWQNAKKSTKKNIRIENGEREREATLSLHNRVSVWFHFIFALISRTITMMFCYVVPNSVGRRLCLSYVGRPTEVSVVARFFIFFLFSSLLCVALTSTCCVQVVQSATVQM